jgi:hypothetical protein
VPRWDVLSLIIEHLNGDTTHLLALWVAARDAEDQRRSFPVITPHAGRPPAVATGANPAITIPAAVTAERLRASFAPWRALLERAVGFRSFEWALPIVGRLSGL